MHEAFFGYLLHLGTNMWSDAPGTRPNSFSASLRCDDAVWERVTHELAEAGATMAVIDVADGVELASHPEIAVEGAWSRERLSQELTRLRVLGLEPIPKLNFSTTHDAWLGQYSRMVSTEPYYQVCRDLITEVAELFDTPRFFHLGMDEESSSNQGGWQIAITRQQELWWHDLEFLVAAVESAGSRAWIWSDHAWAHPDEFYDRMSHKVLQSNWYYRNAFAGADEATRPQRLGHTEEYVTYLDLADHDYDQVPTGSNWLYADNLTRTVEFTRRRLGPDRVLGFLQTSWRTLLPDFDFHHTEAIADLATAVKLWHTTEASSDGE